MAVRANRGSTSRAHPHAAHRQSDTIAGGARRSPRQQESAASRPLHFDRASGRRRLDALQAYAARTITALVRAAAEFLRLLSRTSTRSPIGRTRNNVLVIAVVNPTSLALLKPPGEWGTGVDGSAAPTSCAAKASRSACRCPRGGPYFGFMTTRMQYVRQMPGRIVGRTLDAEGRPGLHADAAGARAAHPPRQGHLEHLHQSGPDGDGRDHLHVAARAPRASRAWRPRACSAPRELVQRSPRIGGVRAAFAGAALSRGGAHPRPAGGAGARGARRARHLRRPGSDASTIRSLGRALLVCATETKPTPISSAMRARSATCCTRAARRRAARPKGVAMRTARREP